MYKSLPNVLTIIRILLTPLFVVLMLKGEPNFLLYSLLLIFVISITDFLDGYFARAYGLVSNLGKYLDPLADKMFILTVFITLCFLYPDYIPMWMIVLIVIRDLVITFLRNFFINKGLDFKTSIFAKNKTLFQIISIHLILIFLIINEYSLFYINLDFIYYVMFLCTLVTIISGAHYIKEYFYLKKNES
tara:strand:+ start:294 stop:860 length:567 start_codon:yes stop_codon:yes gene_type:complete